MKNILTFLMAGMIILIGTYTYADQGDGTFIGVSALTENGPSNTKVTILFLGDGFTANEQDRFNEKVDLIVNHLFSRHPFNALHCAFNIYRINIASVDSGIDIPTCNGANSGDHTRRTAMNATYCSDNVDRCIFGDASLVAFWANMANVANFNDPNVFTYVLVNETKHGGCASGHLAFGCIEDGMERVFVHEFGHSLSSLADEYSEDPGRNFPPSEPSRVNITLNQDRNTLKWNDLILSSTNIPSRTCKEDQDDPSDLVGLFEGANYNECGIFRPSSHCTMRESEAEFCSVCRRKIMQDVQRFVCTPIASTFTDLLIRDDEDPWPRGEGEIYFHYTMHDDVGTNSGRWPGGDGESDFDDDEDKGLNNFFIGTLGNIGTTRLQVQMRESDWPDGDDDLADDADEIITSLGPFTIDKSDYKLEGQSFEAPLKFLLDAVNIKDDNDDISDGDIFIKYSISNGNMQINGRWPSGDGNVGIGTGSTENIGIFAAALPFPGEGEFLRIHVEVWDDDGWFTGGDDLLGSGDFAFDGTTAFGTTSVVHIGDSPQYRLTYSLMQ